MRKFLPNVNFFLGKKVPEQPGYEIVEHVGSGNNAHVFRAHSKKVNNDIACKIIPKENLRGDISKQTWRAEIDSANILDSRIVVRFWDVADWIEPNDNINCTVLYSEYVYGKNLDMHIKERKEDISVGFIEEFLKEMLSFIDDMERHNVKHGDLHSKNILVEDRSKQLGGPLFTFRVTDFGVATVTSDASFKDDYDQLAIVLRELLENVNYSSTDPRGKYAFNLLNDHFLARYFCEKDITREPSARQTRLLYKLLEDIDSEFANLRRQSTVAKLVTPFDFLSCEQIGESHSLFKALYSSLFLGLKQIESKNNLVLTGPRGCGKTTVFKSLSLRYRFLVGEADPKGIDYIGLYYRCDDLYFGFPRYKLSDKPEGYDIPLHYVTSTLIHEVLESIEIWSMHYFKKEFLKNEAKLSYRIWEIMDFVPPHEPGSCTFKALCVRLQKERRRAANKQRFINTDQPIGQYFGPDILLHVCSEVVQMLSYLQDMPFYFFIDDYSIPKITADLQKNINRLFMQRTPFCFFKVSTESPVSYVRADIDGKTYAEGREFSLLNLGSVYLKAKLSETLKFLEDVFFRRFKAIKNYPVSTLEELVGTNNLNSIQIAHSIRKGEKPEIWGKEVLGRLCSGDIFYIINLVKRMVASVGNDADLASINTSPKIFKDKQRDAIREEAGNFLNSVRGIEDGDLLVQIVTAFGNVAHSYLKFRNSGDKERKPPYLASRIEPIEELNLCPDAQKIYEQLLRYSLFIEDPRGKSITGRVVPRLYLRRALLPHFNLAFSKRDSIRLNNEDIELLLLKPKEFEDKHQLQKPETGQMTFRDIKS